MSDHLEQRVAVGETSEVVYDGQYFLAKYLEVAQAAMEAKRLSDEADSITNAAVEKLMDPQSGEPMFTRAGQIPEALARELAADSLIALVYRSRARHFRKLRSEAKHEFTKTYLDHYSGRKLKITAREGSTPIRKQGLRKVGQEPPEVIGKLNPHDIDLVTKDRPLLHIWTKADWYSVQVLDHETLEPLIDIETLE